MMRTYLQHAGWDEPRTVVLERAGEDAHAGWVAQLDDRQVPFTLDEAGRGSGVLRIGARVCPYHAVRTKTHLLVWVGGRTFRFEVVDPSARRAAGAVSAGLLRNITAPMPGRVLKINVSADEAFAAHAPLVILESMKMEMTLSAPAPGRARRIDCAVGDMVEMGAVLIHVDQQ